MASRAFANMPYLLASCCAAFTAQATELLIDFEFMDAVKPADSPSEVWTMESPAEGGREAQLDEILSTVLLPPTMINEGQNYESVEHAGPIGIQGQEDSEIRPPDNADPESEAMNFESGIFGTLLRDLLPGPFLPMDVDESQPQPFSVPDPFVLNILQDFDSTFLNNMMPAIHKASSQERMPNSCVQDIQAKCPHAKSYLHCLGMNHESISADCRKDVEHSVPFLCSSAIDKWCDDWNDPSESSVLSCLRGHMDNLGGKCRDAVLTTDHVIKKANAQKAFVVDPPTGRKRVSIPEVKSDAGLSASAIAAQHEAYLDAKLGLTPGAKTNSSEASSGTGSSSARDLEPPYSLLDISKPVVAVLFLAVIVIIAHLMIGIATYAVACQGSSRSASPGEHLPFAQQRAPHGVKLATDILELPKSTNKPQKHCAVTSYHVV